MPDPAEPETSRSSGLPPQHDECMKAGRRVASSFADSSPMSDDSTSTSRSAEFMGNQRSVLQTGQLPFDRFQPTPYTELVDILAADLIRWDDGTMGRWDDGTMGQGDKGKRMHAFLTAIKRLILSPGLWTRDFTAPRHRPKKNDPALTCPFSRAGISSWDETSYVRNCIYLPFREGRYKIIH